MPSQDGETLHEVKTRHKLTLGKYKIFLMLLLGLGFVKDLALFGLVLASLAKPMPVGVIRGTGEKDRIDFQVGLEREPALVKSFIITSMRNLHTWVNVLPDAGQPPDPGVAVGDKSAGALKIPTIVFRYSLAMEDKFGQEYRKSLGQLIAASQLQDPETQVAYKISQTTEPIKLKNGDYKMSLVGTLIKYRPGATPVLIPFNKTVTAKAIPPFTLSEAMRKYPSDANIAQALALVTVDGLQITNITDYQPE
ncbi:hypothetical protein [Merismopedia glauca]|nr:hypothetical protein [Merismopedia glauca]